MLALGTLVYDLLQASIEVAVGVPAVWPRGVCAALRLDVSVGDLIQHLGGGLLFPKEGQLPPADLSHGAPRAEVGDYLKSRVKGDRGQQGEVGYLVLLP